MRRPLPVSLPGDVAVEDRLVETPLAVSDALNELIPVMGTAAARAMDGLESVHRTIQELEDLYGQVEAEVERHLQQWAQVEEMPVYYLERFVATEGATISDTAVDPNGGKLTLRPIGREDLTGAFRSVRLLRQYCRGIPGNNMVVDSITWPVRGGREQQWLEWGIRLLPKVTPAGESDNHANIAALFDNRPDTHFEWEYNVVKRRQRARHIDGVFYLRSEQGSEVDVEKITEGKGWTVRVIDPEESTEPVQYPLAAIADSPPADELAQLVMEIELDPSANGMLDILPMVVGGIPPRLFLLQAMNSDGEWEDLLYPVSGLGSIVLGSDADFQKRRTIPMLGYRAVRIGFRAGGWYTPRLGLAHPAAVGLIYERFEQKALGFALKTDDRYLKWRLDTEAPTIGSMVVEHNDRAELAGRVVGTLALAARGITMKWLTSAIGAKAVAWLGPVAPVVALVMAFSVLADFIFKETKRRELRDVVTGFDVFSGWRSVIALREIALYRATYPASGYWQSLPIILSRPVQQVRIHAEHDVPDGTAVRYLLSTDGTDWKPLVPVSDGGQPLVLDKPASRVWLRVELSTSVEHLTPAVYAVLLEGVP